MKTLLPPRAITLLLILFLSSPYLLAGPKPFLGREKGVSEKSSSDITEENRRQASLREDADDSDASTSANISRASSTAAIAEQPQKEVVDSVEMNPQLFTPEELNTRVLRVQQDILKWQQGQERLRRKISDSDIQENVELLNKAKIDMQAYKQLKKTYANFAQTTYFTDSEVMEKLPALMTSFEHVLAEIETMKTFLGSTELDDDDFLEADSNAEEVDRIVNDFLKLKGNSNQVSPVSDRYHLSRGALGLSSGEERMQQTSELAQHSRLNAGSSDRNSSQNLALVRATQVQQSRREVIAVPYMPPIEAIEMNDDLEQRREGMIGRTLGAMRRIDWNALFAHAFQNMSTPFNVNPTLQYSAR